MIENFYFFIFAFDFEPIEFDDDELLTVIWESKMIPECDLFSQTNVMRAKPNMQTIKSGERAEQKNGS